MVLTFTYLVTVSYEILPKSYLINIDCSMMSATVRCTIPLIAEFRHLKIH